MMLLVLVAMLAMASASCHGPLKCSPLSLLFDRHVFQASTNVTQAGLELCGSDRSGFAVSLKACATQMEASMGLEHGKVSTPAYNLFDQYCTSGNEHLNLTWLVESGQALTAEFGLPITLPNGTLVESASITVPTPAFHGINNGYRCFCDGGRCSRLHSAWSSLTAGGTSADQIGKSVCDSKTMLYYLHECFTCALGYAPAAPSNDNYTIEIAEANYAEGAILETHLAFCRVYWAGGSKLATFNITEYIESLNIWSHIIGVTLPNGTQASQLSRIAARAIGFTSSIALESTSTTTSFVILSSTTTLSSTLNTSSTLSLTSFISSSTSSESFSKASLTSSSSSSISTSSIFGTESTSKATNSLSSVSNTTCTTNTASPAFSSSAPYSGMGVISSTSTSTFTQTRTTTVFLILTDYDPIKSSAPSAASVSLIISVSSDDALLIGAPSRLTVTETLKSTTTVRVSIASNRSCALASTTTITVYGTPPAVQMQVTGGSSSVELIDSINTSIPGEGFQSQQLNTNMPAINTTAPTLSSGSTSYTRVASPPTVPQTADGVQLGSSIMAAAVLVMLLPFLD